MHQQFNRARARAISMVARWLTSLCEDNTEVAAVVCGSQHSALQSERKSCTKSNHWFIDHTPEWYATYEQFRSGY